MQLLALGRLLRLHNAACGVGLGAGGEYVRPTTCQNHRLFLTRSKAILRRRVMITLSNGNSPGGWRMCPHAQYATRAQVGHQWLDDEGLAASPCLLRHVWVERRADCSGSTAFMLTKRCEQDRT